jgi:glycosyltransferase involved in cell wall biosynthesis
LGVAGFPKGLDILVNAVEGILDLLREGKLRLLVQFNIHIASRPLEKLHKELSLRARDIPGIEIVGGPLTPAQYQQAMNDSDVILVPHRRQSYKYALSGIFTEALSVGKPVVVASDTYMAEELQRFGAGICFEDGNPRALAQAIRAAVEDIEGLRRRAFEAQAAWRSMHNAERYVTELYAVVNRG